jgi:nucleoside-diphosphate-sugar epimerase
MARCLIIGCGCRGRALAARLRAQGHAVRGTTREQSKVELIDAVGVEAIVADPDRVATLAGALEQVTIACVLLGSVVGPSERVASLHSTRLQMLLERMLDTTVRGVVYEAAGTVEPAILSGGAAAVRAAFERSQLPYALLTADPSDHDAWLLAAVAAVDGLLSGR